MMTKEKLLIFINELEQDIMNAIEIREENDEYDPVIAEEKAGLDVIYLIKRFIDTQ